MYDVAGTTSQSEFDDLFKITVDLFNQIKKWLRKNHPELIENR
jgi:hypothetical protein